MVVGEGKPLEGTGEGVVVLAPFGETILEINTCKVSTPPHIWPSVAVIFWPHRTRGLGKDFKL